LPVPHSAQGRSHDLAYLFVYFAATGSPEQDSEVYGFLLSELGPEPLLVAEPGFGIQVETSTLELSKLECETSIIDVPMASEQAIGQWH